MRYYYAIELIEYSNVQYIFIHVISIINVIDK